MMAIYIRRFSLIRQPLIIAMPLRHAALLCRYDIEYYRLDVTLLKIRLRCYSGTLAGRHY